MVLSILGTTLFLLLSVILVLLFLLFLFLLLPIHYKVLAEYQETLCLRGNVTWLAAIIFVQFSYSEGTPQIVFRIFGLDIRKFLAARKDYRKKRAEKRRFKQKTGKQSQKGFRGEAEKKVRKKSAEGSSENASGKLEKGSSENVSGKSEKGSSENISGKSAEETSRNIPKKSSGISKKGIRKNSYKNFRKKLKRCIRYKKFWQQENTKRMVCILKDNMVHLWRKLKPRAVRGSIEFGTGDPCLTGEFLGVAALFYAYYGNGITVIPDFEEKRLAGRLLIKGHISLITIVLILLRIWLDGSWSFFPKKSV